MSVARAGDASSSIAVCGLGTLGQYCVSYLKEFGVRVVAADARQAPAWELAGFPGLLDSFVSGDCREPAVLERLDLKACRAILILTKDERVNIATAFAARAINPAIRIVVRSSQASLNDLLGRHLGDFVAMEPTAISADAFALAAMGDETLGLFEAGGRLFRVSSTLVDGEAERLTRRELATLNTHASRLLGASAPDARPAGFHGWQPEARAAHGDIVTVVALDGENPALTPSSSSSSAQQNAWGAQRPGIDLRARLRSFWTNGTQTQRAAVLCAIVIPIVYALGTILYKQHYKDITWHDALNVSMVLILGGYDNLFGSLKLPFPIPAWLHIFSVAQTVAGTLFIGIVYAFLTERVLSARFQFRRRRPPMPRGDHTVIVGMGRVGRAVAQRLAEFGQPMIATDTADLDTDVLPGMPFIVGDTEQTLERVNLETCRALMALTNDEVANLELALLARAANAECELVIRTDDPYFSKNVSELVPRAYALGVNALAAEAFAAAAFGETILSLFRVNGRTALVTVYQVEANDALDGRLLSSVAYGYDVVPLVLERTEGEGAQRAAKIFPTEEVRLCAGDTLIVLATIDGLQRIEHGQPIPPSWTIEVRSRPSNEAAFEGAMTIARLSGCEPELAHAVIDRAPASLGVGLYEHQALELVRTLRKNLVEARAVPLGATVNTPVLNLS